ncbi:MAG TPA: hypothetical protein VHK26_15080 [Methyloceanibacter sp.]|nr:hypothetical protein [Methyloceanibacter sp.]
MRALILAGGLAVLLIWTCPPGAAEASFNDVTAYCKAVGDVDAPDAKYPGPKVPDWMVIALYTPDEIKAQTASGIDPAHAIVWRCMGGAVYGCVQGNAPICGKANQDKTPTKAMREFCASQPNADVIPLVVIGHENPMIYDWSCKGKEPTITKQIFKVDAQGFPVELWKEIAPAKH